MMAIMVEVQVQVQVQKAVHLDLKKLQRQIQLLLEKQL
jgi:hypothetical protein